MEPLTAAAAAGLVMKYLLPAIRNLGGAILEKSEDGAADAAIGFGKRLLRALLGRRDQAGATETIQRGVERRVIALARTPDGQKGASQLEGAIEDLLTADEGLLAAISVLLERAPETAPDPSSRSTFIGGGNSGVVITGDGNAVTRL